MTSAPVAYKNIKPHEIFKRHRAKLERTDRWGTPPWLVEIVHRVLGGIDTDPCSEPIFNAIVRATSFFQAGDERDHDLSTLPWGKRVWLNPPREIAASFWNLLVDRWQAREVDCAMFVCYANAKSLLTSRYVDYPYHSGSRYERKGKPKVDNAVYPSCNRILTADLRQRIKFLQVRHDLDDDNPPLIPNKTPWDDNCLMLLPSHDARTAADQVLAFRTAMHGIATVVPQ